MPALVPTQPDDPASQDNRVARVVLSRREMPFQLASSDRDPITAKWHQSRDGSCPTPAA